MKIRFTTLAISILVKPAVLAAAFAAVSRAAEFSEFGREVIEPAASSIAAITPLSYDYAAVMVTGILAYGLMRILCAVGGAISATVR